MSKLFAEDCPSGSQPNKNKVCADPKTAKPVTDKVGTPWCDKGHIYDRGKDLCVPMPKQQQSYIRDHYKAFFQEETAYVSIYEV